MIIPVKNVGAIGVVKDLSQHELPINAWSDSQNIRFLDGYAYQFYGHGQVYGTPSIVPHHIFPVMVGSARHWIYAGLAKVYDVTITAGSAVHTNITRQTAGNDVDYTGAANAWTSTVIGGIPVLNPGNTTDPPQFWALTGKLAALTNWPATTYCAAMRSFKNYLIALNVTKGSTNYPFMVKWSHPAVPGALPSTWNEADTTKDAGESDLAEGHDHIIDGLQLRDSFMIYKESSIWRMDYTGGPYVFRFTKVLGTSGAMNRNCIVEVDGVHFVLTGSDVIVHDGQQPVSVLDKQARRWMFQNIDVDGSSKCFVFKNPFLNEVYACFPSIGATVPDLALVWNYRDKTVSFRDIPNLNHANFGTVDNTLGGTWAADSDPWASDLTLWNGPDFTPNTARVLMASNDTKLYMLDASASFDGTIPSAYLERRGLSFDDPESMKLVKGIRPRFTGNTGDTVKVYVGATDDPWAEPTYTEMTHTIGTTISNDCLVSGRYIAIKFATGTAYQWRLDSYDIDVEKMGNW